MNCIKCGADNGDGAAVCKNCGESIDKGAVAQSVMKRGKIGLIIGIAAAVVAISAIAAVFLFTSNAAPVSGNTPMNIQNGGLAAENGGWIYYCNEGDGRSLYKIRTDGTEKMKLNNEWSDCINIAGGWVYYRNLEGRSICRVRTDGTDGKILNEDMKVLQLLVYEDWIYYTGLVQGDVYMYRMRTDGTEETGFDVMSVSFNINDGWIYYKDYSEEKGYKMRLDGTDKTMLDEDYSYAAFIDGWIYYRDKGNPTKVRMDGTEKEVLTDDIAQWLNISDGWVYYSSLMDGCIFKVRADGTEKTKLNGTGGMLNIAGDWIYYINSDGIVIYRMKTDGTKNGPVN